MESKKKMHMIQWNIPEKTFHSAKVFFSRKNKMKWKINFFRKKGNFTEKKINMKNRRFSGQNLFRKNKFEWKMIDFMKNHPLIEIKKNVKNDNLKWKKMMSEKWNCKMKNRQDKWKKRRITGSCFYMEKKKKKIVFLVFINRLLNVKKNTINDLQLINK